MKIQIASDLHTEFHRPSNPYVLPKTDADIIVLAGDVGVGFDAERVFCEDTVKDHGKDVVIVLGNHSFYGKGNIDTIRQQWHDNEAKGVHYLDECSSFISDDGVLFVGGILWTDFDNYNVASMDLAHMHMNDYAQSYAFALDGDEKDAVVKLTPRRTVNEHYKIKKWIETEIADKRGSVDKIVVVSHHLPSYKSVSPYFLATHGSALNAAYASHLDQWIEDIGGVDLWVHGHTHVSLDYALNDGTRVVCNPRGYYGYALNRNFNDTLVVSV